jgi:uncharacterized protein
MTTFVDTSALYAILDADDEKHVQAAGAWRQLIQGQETLVTHSYVLVETFALVQHRLGMAAVRALQVAIAPLLAVHYVEAELYAAALAALLTAGRRELSLTDCVSFSLMRSLGLRQAYTLDRHYVEQGFDVVP